ncbi:TAMM41 [Cordylochernes scorpioides]|uniref:Phosphatidate cytidylyltransferase, mitochondrial n=1 Tax=Cordylochernes scorpioides TaxID=51811 RepID=A0ABY6LGD4_9ARAC|nr:TAMM41 [Cordylochernes scorpioides]
MYVQVVWIQPPSEQDLQRALNFNLTSAVRVAMLLLPEIFTDEELFLKIANLSYTGDFRMKIAEDQNKVKNIVRPQLDAFWKLYEPHIFAMKIHWNSLTRIMEQDISPAARIQHLSELPKMIRHQLLLLYSKDGHYLDVEDVLITVAHDSDCGELINTGTTACCYNFAQQILVDTRSQVLRELVCPAINRIVSDSSWRQSLKGIFTAGLLKSVKYSTSKVRRRVESLNPTNPS